MRPVKDTLAWIPNLFTLANLSMGFFAILISTWEGGDRGRQAIAGGLVVLAMLSDGLDGFAARLLKAKSNLGAYLDSIADMVTFGIAPAAIMYSFVLSEFDYTFLPGLYIPSGMLVAVSWPICAAYRLARFNVKSRDDSFEGLPSPAAAVIVALMPIVFSNLFFVPTFILVCIYVSCAFLMVSTVRYAKPQTVFVRRFSRERLIIMVVVLLLVLLAVGWFYGELYVFTGLFGLFALYIVAGLVSLTIHTIQKYRM